MEHCIVCGMEVKISEEAERIIYNNKTYFFCTTLCKILFEQEPEKFIQSTENEKNN